MMKTLRQISIGTLMLLFWAQATHAQNNPALVILFGDSITIGYNLEEGYTKDLGRGRTVSQLPGSAPTEELFNDLNGTTPPRPAIVVNWGDGGSNTAQGLGRMSDSLDSSRSSYPSSNSSVMILYGTNDFGSGISASSTAINIRAMVDKANRRGITPVIGTVLPRSDRSSSFSNDLNSRIRSAAGSTKIIDLYSIFVNTSGGYQTLLSQEASFLTGQQIRLHPNRSGYKVIAQSWFNGFLRDRIPEQQITVEPEPDPVIISPIIDLLFSKASTTYW